MEWFVRRAPLITTSLALVSLWLTMTERTPITRWTVLSIVFDISMALLALILHWNLRILTRLGSHLNSHLLSPENALAEVVGSLAEQLCELSKIVQVLVDRSALDAKAKRRIGKSIPKSK